MYTYRDLFRQITEGNLSAIQNALNEGFNINETDKWGFLLLHRACANHQNEIVSLLIERGSKLDGRATDGWTPLHLAAVSGAVGCLTMLVKAGADPNAQDEYGCTPLHLSVTSRNPAVAEELVGCGANKSIKNDDGLTPLQRAKERGAVALYDVLGGE